MTDDFDTRLADMLSMDERGEHHDEAIDLFEQALAANPANVQMQYRYLNMLVTRARMADYEAQLAKALDAIDVTDEVYDAFHLPLAKLAVERAQLNEAEQLIELVPVEKQQGDEWEILLTHYDAYLAARRDQCVRPMAFSRRGWETQGPKLLPVERDGLPLVQWIACRLEKHEIEPGYEVQPTDTIFASGALVREGKIEGHYDMNLPVADLPEGLDFSRPNFIEMGWYAQTVGEVEINQDKPLIAAFGLDEGRAPELNIWPSSDRYLNRSATRGAELILQYLSDETVQAWREGVAQWDEPFDPTKEDHRYSFASFIGHNTEKNYPEGVRPSFLVDWNRVICHVHPEFEQVLSR